MNNVYVGLNKRFINHGCYVYHDTSLRWKRKLKNGKIRKYYHDCWRADVTLIDCNGARRIRKRFKTKAEADAWLGIYKQ